MAQVPFLTNITLYRNVPLAPNYRDTVYFADHTEQQTWFAAFDSVSYTGQMYQRVGKNRVRLEGNPRQYEGVNYMKFQNYMSGANNKWWFAFVLETEYINENVFEVEYEIDVMQSFLVGVEYELLDCYVEREHQATDTAGDNLLKEPVDIGDHIIMSTTGAIGYPSGTPDADKDLNKLAYIVAIMPLHGTSGQGTISIISQPESVDAYQGQVVHFSVEATGDGLTYQWYGANDPNGTFSAIDGSAQYADYTGYDTNTLSLYVNSANYNGYCYYCVISDRTQHSAMTAKATIRVIQ